MKKRMILTVAAMAVFLTLIGTLKVFQIRAAIAQYASFQPPPEAVTTAVAKSESWPSSLEAVGSVVAVQGVTVSADLPGIVEKIAFDSGATVRKGDLLVQLDTRQERAQLAAAEAERRLAELNLRRAAPLREKGIVAQSELDKDQAEMQQAEARENEIRAAIERKTIRAPFSGRLGIRQVNLGQYLDAGSPVVPLQTLDPIYVVFSVPQQDVGKLHHGDLLEVEASGLPGHLLAGRITAIDSVADIATRNVQVQATFDNPEAVLRSGMFVNVHVQLGEGPAIVSLPASSIKYAPYGDSVFVVADLEGKNGETYRGVREQIVKLGASRGDQVAVLSGLSGGEEVVTSGVFKLRPGAAVAVDNSVQPGDNPAPKPEDS
jgi:membrane fusion protein (multidrug efflux system)